MLCPFGAGPEAEAEGEAGTVAAGPGTPDPAVAALQPAAPTSAIETAALMRCPRVFNRSSSVRASIIHAAGGARNSAPNRFVPFCYGICPKVLRAGLR
ncbi:hypothetical protein TBS_04430 [Thermobispora bispora]